MTIQEYVDNLNKQYRTGRAREHSYRSDLQTLLSTMLPQLLVTNEPSRSEVGAPDYILTKGNIPVGYIEAKDIDDGDLDGKKKNKEQFNRYKSGLPNLIFTDYLEFHFYKEGELTTTIHIAEVVDGEIVAIPKNFDTFKNLIKDFSQQISQSIRSSSRLSKMMAGKARILADVIEKALNVDEKSQKNQVNSAANNTLREQLTAFQNVLIADIKPKEFGDIYAQTIAYGMFAARLHDPTLETFSRQEAAELIPKTNPFLRKLFQYIAGYDLDDRIAWVVDGLADIFRATDVDGLLKNFGKSTQQNDPIIHFYETFLAEYDPKLRKSRGVWYTPEPIVNFIVRAVDDILKDEFGLKDGLADTSKTKIKVKVPTHDKRHKDGMVEEEREVHRVQILDPATGTGTFLAEVIKQIYAKFEGQQGIWTKYVEEHLIPRLNGFEILMASYAMAHLKLDLLLQETGYNASASGTTDQRFKVYLTNSLEEHHPDSGTLFANWLSEEANEANHIKRDTPVMVVMGNPPYSVSSSNKGEWIQNLISDYKKDLNERKINLDDDYIKFIRYGQYFIEKNGEGILAYISNNSFLDGLTHRKMREDILKTFDKTYVIDLHGNSNRKESAPDGSKDENVFDIQQGVSINIFIKNNLKAGSAIVKHYDIYGKREYKYQELRIKSIDTIDWANLDLSKPYYFFVPKDFNSEKSYKEGFKIDALMSGVSGIETKRDAFAIDFNKETLVKRIADFVNQDYSSKERKKIFGLRDNEWVVDEAVELLRNDMSWKNSFQPCLHRPFDFRSIIYSDVILSRSRGNLMAGMNKNNIGLIAARQTKEDFSVLTANMVSTHKIVTVYDRSFMFPLYLYPEESGQQTLDGKPERVPNLDKKILKDIEAKLGLKFVPEKEENAKDTQSSTQIPDQARDDDDGGTKQSSGKESVIADKPDPQSPETEQITGDHVASARERGDRHVASARESGQKEGDHRAPLADVFAPIDLLDYIYAVLHSPDYREKYKEFLKIDFPRVPYPDDPKKFWELVKLGGELRQIHLLEADVVEDFITTYPIGGDNVVRNKITKNNPGFVADEPSPSRAKESPDNEQPTGDHIASARESGQKEGDRRAPLADGSGTKQSPESGQSTGDRHVASARESELVGKVWINETQYFDNVPETAWEFYIGGYQPAQKWLKDRRDRELSIDDIRHYQKIIVALTETDRIMKEIDEIGVIELTE